MVDHSVGKLHLLEGGLAVLSLLPEMLLRNPRGAALRASVRVTGATVSVQVAGVHIRHVCYFRSEQNMRCSFSSHVSFR